MARAVKLFVTAKPRARREGVEKIDETHFVVAVKESPVEGRANAAIVKALAGFLHVAPSRLRIVSGYASHQKIIEILV